MKERMAMRLSVLSVIVVLLGSLGLAAAQDAPSSAQAVEGGAPTVVSYQGQVLVGGTPYTGTGHFKFAVVDSGTTSFWSNNGSSTGGSEPTASVALAVSNGLFNVLLGDTALGGMTHSLSPSVFSDTDRWLRTWFSSDGSTFTLLDPDRRIAAVPYALQAQEAVNADTLDGLQGSAYQVQVSGACAVGSAIRAVNADGSVDCEPHDARPVFSLTTVGSGGDVGEYASITIGADGLPVVSYYDPANWLLKVAHCEDPACISSTTTTVDSAVSSYTSITIGSDGLPVVSYGVSYYDYDTGSWRFYLKVAHCGTADCTTVDPPTIVDSGGDVGEYTSITIGADGLPVVSYRDATNTDLKVAHCGDVACTTSSTTTVDSGGDVGQYTSIAIGTDGLPVISYYDATNLDLKVAHCGNAACTSSTTTSVTSGAELAGFYTSVTIGTDGLPVVSYHDITDNSHQTLKVAHCNDVQCTSSTTEVVDSIEGVVGGYTSITIGADGLPVISYYDSTNADLKVAHCGDVACTTSSTTTVDSGGNVGQYTSITIGTDGLPVVSYMDVTNTHPKVAHCSNAFCVPYWRRR